MYTYHAARRRLLQPFPPRLLVILAGILVGGLILIRLLTTGIYAWQTKRLLPKDNPVYAAYSQKVARETNVSELARRADGLLKGSFYPYAALNFRRASDLDPDYRDAAYGWAYAIVAEKKADLSEEERGQIHTALGRAEAVDPLYRPMLELKAIVATIEGDKEAKEAVEERLKLLPLQ